MGWVMVRLGVPPPPLLECNLYGPPCPGRHVGYIRAAGINHITIHEYAALKVPQEEFLGFRARWIDL